MLNSILSPMKLNDVDTSDIVERFYTKIDRSSNNCWIWKGRKTKGGYGNVDIIHDGKWRGINAHRLSYLLIHGEVPDNIHVCHSCDNPPCCRPDHLWLGTFEENMQDAIDKGRKDNTGEKNGRRKINWETVNEIRACKDKTRNELAKEYGLKKMQVGNIIRNISWHDPEYIPPKSPYRTWSEEDINDVCNRRNNGATFESIAKSYGVHWTRVWQIEKKRRSHG